MSDSDGDRDTSFDLIVDDLTQVSPAWSQVSPPVQHVFTDTKAYFHESVPDGALSLFRAHGGSIVSLDDDPDLVFSLTIMADDTA